MPIVAPLPRRRPRAAAVLAVAACLWASGLSGGGASCEVGPDLQKKINAAVDRGASWLEKQRLPDGSFDAMIMNGEPRYQMGLAALCGLALLAAGEAKTGPGMLQTLEFLKGRDVMEGRAGVRTTYGVGLLLMFVTEMHRPEPKPDKDAGRYAKARAKDPCGLPKDLAAWVQELAAWLLSVQMDDGWWRYPHTPPSDLSNTQYALLGLRAARECGATVPVVRILRTLESALEGQQKDGPKRLRIIKGSGKPGDSDYAVDGGDRARGWGYQRIDGYEITGSMTTAGIAALAICRDMLLKPERFSAYGDDMDRKVGRSVQDGFAWLDQHWSVAFNPPRGSSAWHYYYLYGLERACAFAGHDAVGAHDWYGEGADLLVKQQQADGRWSTGAMGAKEVLPSDLCDTAWALLFLKKASRPTVPIPVPVVTSGK